jgi:hypothetical protein
MKYYKYNRKFYREDDNGRYWVYQPDYKKFKPNFGFKLDMDGNWRLCLISEIGTLKHHLKRKRACEKTEKEVFLQLL